MLAVLFAAAIMAPAVIAESVVVPQSATDPVVLTRSEGMPASSDPSQQLQVFVGAVEACCEGRTPIAGRYAETGDAIAFTPAFGFDPGQDYLARFRTRRGDVQLLPFRIPFEAARTQASGHGDLSKRRYAAGKHPAVLHSFLGSDEAACGVRLHQTAQCFGCRG